jgi:hypothetical protein
MHQLGRDWWKEVGRRFVERGERNRGAVVGGMGAGETVLPVDRDQVRDEKGQSAAALYWSGSRSRPNGYAGIAAAGGMPKRGHSVGYELIK